MGCVSSTVLDLEACLVEFDNDTEFFTHLLRDSKNELGMYYNSLVKSIMRKEYKRIKYYSYCYGVHIHTLNGNPDSAREIESMAIQNLEYGSVDVYDMIPYMKEIEGRHSVIMEEIDDFIEYMNSLK